MNHVYGLSVINTHLCAGAALVLPPIAGKTASFFIVCIKTTEGHSNLKICQNSMFFWQICIPSKVAHMEMYTIMCTESGNFINGNKACFR